MSRSVALGARAVLVVAVGWGLAACGSSSKSSSAPSSSGSAAGASVSANALSSSPRTGGKSNIPAGTALNVGDQSQLIETLFKASGVGAGAPYKINYVQFASGPLVDSGFAAGRIDLGFMGDLPAALAASSGLPVRAVAASVEGPFEFLLAKPGIISIAQLKGKTVAYTTGTAEQAFALRTLASAGLKQSDVSQVNVALQQLYTVLETGSVDASVISSPEQELEYVKQHPGAKVLAINTTVSPATYLYMLATTSALSNSAKDVAILDFTERLIESADWADSHPHQFATDYYVNVEHETAQQAALAVEGGPLWNFVPITSAERQALQNVVDLEYGAGAIKNEFSVSSLFDPTVSAAYDKVLNEVPKATALGSS